MPERLTRGERAADRVAAAIGSWRFITIQTVVILAWIAINVAFLVHPFDRYPFVLLNLVFSTQAAYAAPILQLSGNRQTNKIEDLVEAIQGAVAELVRSDELQEQLARNDAEVLAAILELVQQHRQPTAGR